jgi:hypothetical protein
VALSVAAAIGLVVTGIRQDCGCLPIGPLVVLLLVVISFLLIIYGGM